MNKVWYMYIVSCSDGTLITGITVNINKRIHEHNHGKKGAKYTKSRRPVKLVYKEEHPDRSEASKAEYEIKSFSRSKKLKLIRENENGKEKT